MRNIVLTDRCLLYPNRPLRVGKQLTELFTESDSRTIVLVADPEDFRKRNEASVDQVWPLDDKDYVEVIETIRSNFSVDLVVDTDPDVVRYCYSVGIPAMLLLDPLFTRPEFRPDHPSGVKSWDSLVEEIEAQRESYRKKLEQQPEFGMWE